MDIYLVALLFGGIGLIGMGLLGAGARGHGGLRGGHSAAGHGAGHLASGHAAGHGHAAPGGHAVAHGAPHSHAGGHQAGGAPGLSPLWQLMSPRILFAIAFGIGATGLALRSIFGGIILFGCALIGGLALERLVVQPLWNLLMRFGSNPAMTLESAVTADATVVSSFDANGHGMVSVEVDGQIVQLLATLQTNEIGHSQRVRAGDTVRIEEIDAQRNRCTVSRL
jgi:hypothetical protein